MRNLTHSVRFAGPATALVPTGHTSLAFAPRQTRRSGKALTLVTAAVVFVATTLMCNTVLLTIGQILARHLAP